MKVADQRLELTSGTPPPVSATTESAPEGRLTCLLEDEPIAALSLVQFPNTVKQVSGPTHLPGWRGRPSDRQNCQGCLQIISGIGSNTPGLQ